MISTNSFDTLFFDTGTLNDHHLLVFNHFITCVQISMVLSINRVEMKIGYNVGNQSVSLSTRLKGSTRKNSINFQVCSSILFDVNVLVQKPRKKCKDKKNY